MKLFYPDCIYDRIYDINISQLKEKNIKAIVFDIDNTLAANGDETPDERTRMYIKKLRDEGFEVVIASNNNKLRVEKFCEGLDVLFVHKANKPLGKRTISLLKKSNVKNREACIVGDQIFTDVLCGKLSGFYTILVTPFDDNENKFIKFKRKIENIILRK